MGATSLSSRDIIGEFYNVLATGGGAKWAEDLSFFVKSDQASEEYDWLGMSPAMREWVGGRQAKGVRENGQTILNKDYEATMEVRVKDLRRDKTGQIKVRIAEMADGVNRHWAKILSAQIEAGESTLCYDGQYFFDTDHSEGDSGVQSNDVTSAAATPAAPSAAEMESAIMSSIEKMLGFVDDQAEPTNEDASSFLVMVPKTFWKSAMTALNADVIVDGGTSRTNLITNINGFNIGLAMNPRLSWTTKLATFRTDARTAPFIRQEEVPVEMSAIAEGSELEFTKKIHQYGVYASRAVGFGYWQQGVLTTLV